MTDATYRQPKIKITFKSQWFIALWSDDPSFLSLTSCTARNTYLILPNFRWRFHHLFQLMEERGRSWNRMTRRITLGHNSQVNQRGPIFAFYCFFFVGHVSDVLVQFKGFWCKPPPVAGANSTFKWSWERKNADRLDSNVRTAAACQITIYIGLMVGRACVLLGEPDATMFALNHFFAIRRSSSKWFRVILLWGDWLSA